MRLSYEWADQFKEFNSKNYIQRIDGCIRPQFRACRALKLILHFWNWMELNFHNYSPFPRLSTLSWKHGNIWYWMRDVTKCPKRKWGSWSIHSNEAYGEHGAAQVTFDEMNHSCGTTEGIIRPKNRHERRKWSEQNGKRRQYEMEYEEQLQVNSSKIAKKKKKKRKRYWMWILPQT